MCDRRVKEENLPANLVVIAACNPYRKSVSTSTAGLVYQYADAAASQEELKQLAYMVHPLPEIMKQYVWDFGSLTSQAEEQYIERLLARCSVKQFPQAYRGFCRAVHNSHEFVKENEKELHGMVSLRDVLRCCSLYEWFMEYLRENRNAPHSDVTSARAITLTLAICYYFRLTYVVPCPTTSNSTRVAHYSNRAVYGAGKHSEPSTSTSSEVPSTKTAASPPCCWTRALGFSTAWSCRPARPRTRPCARTCSCCWCASTTRSPSSYVFAPPLAI